MITISGPSTFTRSSFGSHLLLPLLDLVLLGNATFPGPGLLVVIAICRNIYRVLIPQRITITEGDSETFGEPHPNIFKYSGKSLF